MRLKEQSKGIKEQRGENIKLSLKNSNKQIMDKKCEKCKEVMIAQRRNKKEKKDMRDLENWIDRQLESERERGVMKKSVKRTSTVDQ